MEWWLSGKSVGLEIEENKIFNPVHFASYCRRENGLSPEKKKHGHTKVIIWNMSSDLRDVVRLGSSVCKFPQT